MQTVTLTIGHSVAGVPTHTMAHVVTIAADLLALDGLTAYQVRGLWRGVAEDSTRIEVCGLDAAEAARIVDAVPALAHALAQEAIACEVREDATQFVAAWSPAAAQTA